MLHKLDGMNDERRDRLGPRQSALDRADLRERDFLAFGNAVPFSIRLNEPFLPVDVKNVAADEGDGVVKSCVQPLHCRRHQRHRDDADDDPDRRQDRAEHVAADRFPRDPGALGDLAENVHVPL